MKVDSWCVRECGVDVSLGGWRMDEPCAVHRLTMKPGSGLGGGPEDDDEVELIEGGGW